MEVSFQYERTGGIDASVVLVVGRCFDVMVLYVDPLVDAFVCISKIQSQ